MRDFTAFKKQNRCRKQILNIDWSVFGNSGRSQETLPVDLHPDLAQAVSELEGSFTNWQDPKVHKDTCIKLAKLINPKTGGPNEDGKFNKGIRALKAEIISLISDPERFSNYSELPGKLLAEDLLYRVGHGKKGEHYISPELCAKRTNSLATLSMAGLIETAFCELCIRRHEGNKYLQFAYNKQALLNLTAKDLISAGQGNILVRMYNDLLDLKFDVVTEGQTNELTNQQELPETVNTRLINIILESLSENFLRNNGILQPRNQDQWDMYFFSNTKIIHSLNYRSTHLEVPTGLTRSWITFIFDLITAARSGDEYAKTLLENIRTEDSYEYKLFNNETLDGKDRNALRNIRIQAMNTVDFIANHLG